MQLDHELVHEHLSARLDGEPGPLDDAVVEAHLVGCEACRDHAAGLARLEPLVAAFVARPTGDGTAEVLAGAWGRAGAAAAPPPARLLGLQRLLGLAAVVQAVLAVTTLLRVVDPAGTHVGGDLGAYELAAAVGLATAAWRPRLAAGVLPMVGLAAVAGLGLLVSDLAAGLGVVGELRHLVLVVACWPLVVLARTADHGVRPLPA
jgi:predicted anti-sigma-YlaC factor YlaD